MEDTLKEISLEDKAATSRAMFSEIKWTEKIGNTTLINHEEYLLLEKSHANLGVVLDTAHEAKKLIALLLHLMDHNQTDQQLMRYVFTRVEEVLGLGDDYADVDAYGAKHAHYFTLDGKKLIFWPFLFAIKTTDKYIQKSASCGFACLLSNENVEGGELELVEWILDKLREVRSGEWEVALDTLYIISRSISARKALMNKGAVELIATILKKLGTTGNAQHIYELVFVLWSLSLGITDYSDFLRSGVINTLVDLIAAAPSRKVTRMSLATLKNLAEKEQCEVLDEILSAGLLKNIENIVNSNSLKYAGDIEFEFDVKLLHEILLRNFRELSRFDRWSAEINLGSLRWGILHTEKFWKENAKFLEAENFGMLKKLIALLQSPTEINICVALYDIGEFARFYPNGKVVVSRLGGKDVAMEMIASENPEIQRNALQCISKLMVNNWEFLR